MNTISHLQKLLALLVAIATLLFLCAESKFLITGKYSAVSFFDPFNTTYLLLISIPLLVLSIIYVDMVISHRRTRKYLLIIIPCLFSLLSYRIYGRLDTTDKIAYRQDSFFHTYYLYLDEPKKQYMLDIFGLFGKTTLIGDYTQNDSIISLDKTLSPGVNLLYDPVPGNELNLKEMTKFY